MSIKEKISKVLKFGAASICTIAMMLNISNFCYAANSVEDELAIKKVNVLDIMTGTDVGFEEEGTLTRAQAAAIMVRLKGFSETDIDYQKNNAKSLFNDVEQSHWAMGYINIASLYKLVSGTGDGNFEPNAKVKINEFCAMASRALGAGNMINNEGTWPTNYENFAKREGMVNGISRNLGEYATRLEAAKIIANTLELNTWKSTSTSTSGKSLYEREYDKIFRDNFDVVSYTNEVIDEIDKSNKKIKFKKYKDDKESKVPDYKLDKTVDINSLKVDMNVEVWINTKSEKIVMIQQSDKKTSSLQNELDFSSIKKYTKSSNKFTLVIDGTSYVYYMAASLTSSEYRGTYNGEKKTLDELYKILDEYEADSKLNEIVGKVKVTDTNIVWIDLGTYENIGVVREVDENKIYFYDDDDVEGSKSSSSIKATKENSHVTNLSGKEISFDGIQEGYILKYYYDSTNSEYYIIAYTKNEVGTVTKTSSKYIYVDEKKYPISASAKVSKPDEDDQIKIYLNSADEILMYTTNEDIVWLVEQDEIEYSDDDEEEDKIVPVTDENCLLGMITYAEGLTSNRKKVLKLGITNVSGKETIKYVNLDKMLTLFPNKFDEKSILQEEIIKDYVGTWVKYRVESSKYILYQFGNYIYSGLKQDIVNVESGKLNVDSSKFGSYSFNDSSKFYMTSTYSESTLKKTASFEELDLSQLTDLKKYNFSAAGVAGSKLTHIVVKTTTSNLSEVEGTGVVLNYTESSKETTVSVATSLGTRTYKADKSTISSSNVAAGDFIQYKLLGNVISSCTITKPDLASESNSRKFIKAKIINIYEDAVNVRLEDESREFYYTKNVAYVKGTVKGSSGLLTMKSLSGTTKKPNTVTSSEKFSSSSSNVVYCYLIKEDGELKVRAIIY